MDYSLAAPPTKSTKSPCIIVGLFARKRSLTPVAAAIDTVCDGAISALVRRGDFDGTKGRTIWLHCPDGSPIERLLLVGCGPEKEFGENAYRQANIAAIAELRRSGAAKATNYLTDLPVKGRDGDWRLRQAILAAEEATYTFDRYKTAGDRPVPRLKRIALGKPADAHKAPAAVAEAVATAAGQRTARDLANMPGNLCTPLHLAVEARTLARRHRLKVEVLDEKAMEKLGMGALLAVARGSSQPPRLAAIHYRGGARGQKPVVLVGKGITFDTGGISLKPGAEMDEMKFDMSGAASVLGTMEAVARLKLPLNVTGVIVCAENMPDGKASRPGDIVTTMSGQTVEILNTDAEGRLVLCDALAWVERLKPDTVIDIATLTGACVIALGHHASGLLSNHQPLARALLDAGHDAWDRAWEMPLWDDYQEQLKSNFADMANIGGRPAGTITAACFLARFAKRLRWAHLDIAGTAWKSGKEKGATGRPVPLLVQYLIRKSGRK